MDKRRDELLEILATLLDEDLTWFELRTPSVYIRLGSAPGTLEQPQPSTVLGGQAAAMSVALQPVGKSESRFESAPPSIEPVSASKTVAARGLEPAVATAVERQVTAPFAGAFYRRPSPTDHPFVEVGSRVRTEDPVCLVEVMKLFNSVHAGVNGVVISIDVEDGELVEYGQLLMRIAPEAGGEQ